MFFGSGILSLIQGMTMKEPIEVTGIWLRGNRDNGIEVLVEVNGYWRKAITDSFYGEVSHIVEPLGIMAAPVEDNDESKE